jgi:hypothetical protein
MNLGDVKGIGKINAFFPLPSPLQGEGKEGGRDLIGKRGKEGKGARFDLFIQSLGVNGSPLRGDLPIPMVATSDIGAKAAAFLADPEFQPA